VDTTSSPTFAHAHERAFIIDQPFNLFVNRYHVCLPGDANFAPGERVAFCRQKPFALKEDLRVFTDDSMTQEIFRIKARRVIDIGGRYDVVDADGAPLGALERRARESLLRTTWAILDVEGQPLAVVRERSAGVAAVRRAQNVLEFVPIIGGLVGLVMDLLPIPYHFDLTSVDGRAIGNHTRKLGWRDRYRIELTDPDQPIDTRMLMALGIGLDALQSR